MVRIKMCAFSLKCRDYMKLIGRLVGKSIAEGYLLDVHFTGSFYKHILGLPVNYHDIESIDPEYFKVSISSVKGTVRCLI
jgi:hypothetical protein